MKNSLLQIVALFFCTTLFFTACKEDAMEIENELTENQPTQSIIPLDYPFSTWKLASTPVNGAFEYATASNDWRYNFDRAQIAWYSHEPLVCSQQPSCSNSHYTRKVPIKELASQSDSLLFPNNSMHTVQIAFFPNERGPYNYNVDDLTPDGNLSNPETRWGGLQRSLDQPDFANNNIEFIEFWMLDPFLENPSNKGSFYINLGTVSEDILRDGHRSIENGLPYGTQAENTDTTIWGRISRKYVTTTIFESPAALEQQDVGLDGVNNDGERVLFKQYLDNINARADITPSVKAQINNDPANDDFRHPFSNLHAEEVGIIERFKYFNNPQDNSQIDANSSGSFDQTTLPDTEDINNDTSLEQAESFYQYKIELKPGMKVGDKYIIEVKESEEQDINGTTAKWYKFQIPVNDFEKAVGGIDQFTNIEFMRLYLTDFKNPVVLRLARFGLIRVNQE